MNVVSSPVTWPRASEHPWHGKLGLDAALLLPSAAYSCAEMPPQFTRLTTFFTMLWCWLGLEPGVFSKEKIWQTHSPCTRGRTTGVRWPELCSWWHRLQNTCPALVFLSFGSLADPPLSIYVFVFNQKKLIHCKKQILAKWSFPAWGPEYFQLMCHLANSGDFRVLLTVISIILKPQKVGVGSWEERLAFCLKTRGIF